MFKTSNNFNFSIIKISFFNKSPILRMNHLFYCIKLLPMFTNMYMCLANKKINLNT